MKKSFVVFVISIFYIITYFIIFISAEKIRYLSIERPNITYINPKYLTFANQSARRHSRNNPTYYYDLHYDVLIWVDNKLMVDFYFYEWLTNAYKPTFVEMHFKWCDLIHKDKFFGAAMKQGNLSQPCPYPPGAYHLYNMTVPPASIPRTFPFNKGRIYANLTWGKYGSKGPRDWVVLGHVDMEIKTWNKRN